MSKKEDNPIINAHRQQLWQQQLGRTHEKCHINQLLPRKMRKYECCIHSKSQKTNDFPQDYN